MVVVSYSRIPALTVAYGTPSPGIDQDGCPLCVLGASMDDILNSAPIKDLDLAIEEAARSVQVRLKHFIEPAEGTLRRATSRRHHIVFGRRGSGKSSLLRESAAHLTVDRRPIAFVDLEAFKSLSYPDLLLSVLIRTFGEFKNWLDTAAVHPANRTSFWRRVFGNKPTRGPFDKKSSAALAAALDQKIEELGQELHSPEESALRVTSAAASATEIEAEAQAKTAIPGVGASLRFGARDKESQAETVEEEYRRRKVDFLRRHVLDYQQVFRDMAILAGGPAYLFLDDLYQVRRDDQADIIDYFHGVAKDSQLWLKIGTVRHRTTWYAPGDPVKGLKLGDDADEIDLDITLEKYSIAKDFLLKILTNFARDCDLAPISRFLTPGAQDRVVLASGGVARDFLSIFRRSIHVACESIRAGGHRGNIVNTEDVNVAAGEHDTSKREDFTRDTSDDAATLDDQFQQVRSFCLDQVKSNCFLLNKDARGANVDLIHQLVDLKLLHLVRSRVTVSSRPGKIYEGYMLDLSQYAGARKRRNFEMIEFWKPQSKEALRKASLIFIH